uniref:NTF2 domain-containing protein n=1 Tax=Panagrellus redivivus TaxID=6233 RepID=A0A7E4W947_PANRE
MSVADSRQKTKEMVNLVRTFYDKYTEAIDTRRQDVGKYYHPEGQLLFDGHMYKTGAAAAAAWTTKPATCHTFKNLNHNVHQLGPRESLVVILVSGNATYGDRSHMYTQALTCQLENGHLSILSDDYRIMT